MIFHLFTDDLPQSTVRIVNSAGETPKDVARRFGRLGCIAILGGDSGKCTEWTKLFNV